MRRTVAVVLALVAACSSGTSPRSTQPTLPPTTHFDSAAPTTLDTPVTPPPTAPISEKPAVFSDKSAIGYILDNGLVLWVVPPVGHIFAGDGICDHLVGDPATFYARYNQDTVPGFQGLVCHPPSAATLEN